MSRTVAVIRRRREAHEAVLGGLKRHLDYWREREASLTDEIAGLVRNAEDETQPELHVSRAADQVLALDEILDDVVRRVEQARRALDAELERFHARQHPPDPRPLDATLADDFADWDEREGRTRSAKRFRAHAAHLRAALTVDSRPPADGLTVARRSPSSSGRPRGRRTASASTDGSSGDDSGSDAPGEAGHSTEGAP